MAKQIIRNTDKQLPPGVGIDIEMEGGDVHYYTTFRGANKTEVDIYTLIQQGYYKVITVPEFTDEQRAIVLQLAAELSKFLKKEAYDALMQAVKVIDYYQKKES